MLPPRSVAVADRDDARSDGRTSETAPGNIAELDIEKELRDLERMTAGQLQEKYTEVWGERPRSRHRRWLIRRIAWRLQALAEGDVSERARRRAEELADDVHVRVTPPKKVLIPVKSHTAEPAVPPADLRLPDPGGSISRKYKGREILVHVLAKGFQFDRERYKSLSAVAKAITGSHCNGFRVFGLQVGRQCRGSGAGPGDLRVLSPIRFPGRRGGRMTTVKRTLNIRREARGRQRITRETAPIQQVESGRIPRISRLMALAIRFDRLIRDGVVADQSELAPLAHVTQPRMTQIMNLLHLAPDIQDELLFTPRATHGKDPVTERDLRPIAATPDSMWQRTKSAVSQHTHSGQDQRRQPRYQSS